MITDLITPPEKLLADEFLAALKPTIVFLKACRPLSTSMGNVIRFLKSEMQNIRDKTEQDGKTYLLKRIDDYINDRIVAADRVIVQYASKKIRDGDVLLLFGSSRVVEMVLRAVHTSGVKFRVVIVDARPHLIGTFATRSSIQIR